jgi:hypothetical protein
MGVSLCSTFYNLGENIVGYLNYDMTPEHHRPNPDIDLFTPPACPHPELLADVRRYYAYNLDLVPDLETAWAAAAIIVPSDTVNAIAIETRVTSILIIMGQAIPCPPTGLLHRVRQSFHSPPSA